MVGHRRMGQYIFSPRPGLSRITPTALVAKGRNHVTMLTGNAAFPSPDPTLVVLAAGCDTLDAASQAYDFNRGKADKEARDLAFTALKEMVRDLAAYVQTKCNNERDLIVSAGFDVRRAPDPLGIRPAPSNVRALVTPYAGKLELRWAGVRGRKFYAIEMTDIDPLLPNGWQPLFNTTKNRYLVEGLTSNTVYSFRITTYSAAGKSPLSDTSSAKAA